MQIDLEFYREEVPISDKPPLHLSVIDVRPEELLTLCRARLAEWEMPWEIEFRRELPKSVAGKVLRRVLVEEENKADS